MSLNNNSQSNFDFDLNFSLDNPFIYKSKFPKGTFYIICGSLLGFSVVVSVVLLNYQKYISSKVAYLSSLQKEFKHQTVSTTESFILDCYVNALDLNSEIELDENNIFNHETNSNGIYQEKFHSNPKQKNYNKYLNILSCGNGPVLTLFKHPIGTPITKGYRKELMSSRSSFFLFNNASKTSHKETEINSIEDYKLKKKKFYDTHSTLDINLKSDESLKFESLAESKVIDQTPLITGPLNKLATLLPIRQTTKYYFNKLNKTILDSNCYERAVFPEITSIRNTDLNSLLTEALNYKV
ncbi:hypothetical protein QEN19_004251 [Hanseniaspora menglaensis]